MSRVAVLFTGGTISMVVDAGGGRKGPDARWRGDPRPRAGHRVDRGPRAGRPRAHAREPLPVPEAVRDRERDSPLAGGPVDRRRRRRPGHGRDRGDGVPVGPRARPAGAGDRTGAMRAASDANDDGPDNLRNAVRCAASLQLRGAGVLVVLDHTINPADAVTKTHARRSTPSSAWTRARSGGSWTDVSSSTGARAAAAVATDRAADGVLLLTAHVAMDGALLDAAAALGPPGIVVEATGAGNTAASLVEAAGRAIEQGIVVAFTTRCPAGAASDAYAFPGGGATWVRAGRAARRPPLRPEGAHRARRGARRGAGSAGARRAAGRPAGLGSGHRGRAAAADGGPRRHGRLTCRSTRSSPVASRPSPATPGSAGSRRSGSATAGWPSRGRRSSSRRGPIRTPSGSSWSPARSRSRG